MKACRQAIGQMVQLALAQQLLGGGVNLVGCVSTSSCLWWLFVLFCLQPLTQVSREVCRRLVHPPSPLSSTSYQWAQQDTR